MYEYLHGGLRIGGMQRFARVTKEMNPFPLNRCLGTTVRYGACLYHMDPYREFEARTLQLTGC